MKIDVSSGAIEKLMDYVASGIGSVAGTVFATWRAGREADASRILAAGEADAMLISARAQAEARAILASPEVDASVELDIARTVTQRIQFQEEKRQRNIVSVVHQAAEELENKDAPDEPTDHDWAARFFGDVQDVSSPEMQILWAKVLAGEIERPGNTSIRTLSILRNLDQRTANLFRTLCSVCVFLKIDGGHFIDARVPSLGGNPGDNVLQSYGLGFDSLNAISTNMD